MAFTLLDSVAEADGSTGTTTTAIDTTGATLLVAWVTRFLGGTFSDSAGNTWTNPRNPGINNTSSSMYYCLNPTTSASHTVTYSGFNTFPGVVFAAYESDVVPTFDQVNSGQAGSTTSHGPGSITPTSDNSLIVCFQGFETIADTQSIGSGLTKYEDIPWVNGVQFGVSFADLNTQGTAAAINPSWSSATSGDRTAAQMSFYEDSVQPDAIASAEAFGTASVTAQSTPTIEPSGIASAEAFGSHTVNALQTITLTAGISSAEAFGTPAVTTGQILPFSITSDEAFGTAQVILEGINPTGIASAEAFGTHKVNLETNILGNGIASAEAFGTHIVQTDIYPTGIASAEAFGSHIVEDEGVATQRRPLFIDLDTGDIARMTDSDAVAGPSVTTILNNSGGQLDKATPVYHTGVTNEVDEADASAISTAVVLGMVKSDIADGSTGQLVTNGPLSATLAEWDARTGGTGGLTPGDEYYLSETTGEITATPVTTAGAVHTYLGVAQTPQILNVNLREVIIV